MSKKEEKKEIEEIIKLAREEKIAEEEIIKQSFEEKNKLIEELKEANKELNKQILYLKAEFENYRKRAEKEKQQKFILGKINVIEHIINLYEMFSYALNNINDKEKIEEDPKFLNIFEGIRLLYKEFENFLSKEGIKKIECLNQKFNPSYHEAVETVEVLDENEDDKIIEVVSDGYIFIDKEIEYTLKPAKVKIAKYKPQSEKENFETKNNEISSNKEDKEQNE
ncbi:MAG: nucleotide exchange factor GrpE [Endomicrobiia bacterium]